VRLLRFEHRLETPQDLCGLCGVAPRAYVQLDVRPGQSQIIEEDAGERIVVVLACVNESGLEEVRGLQGPEDGTDLHEVGACARDA
jgi:hypothetical protein